MKRLFLLALATSLLPASLALAAADAPAAAAPSPKVLRYAFRTAESGFDPAQVTDLYSNTIVANLYDAPL